MSNELVGLLFGGWLIVYGIALWRARRAARKGILAAGEGETFWQDWLALGGLGLATLGFFWRQLFTEKAWVPAGGGDLASFIYPMYHFVARSLKQGIIPLWNPYLYGGAPFVADIQSGVLYPVNWLFFLLSGDVSYRLVMNMAFFHVFLAGISMYFCLRYLNRRPLPVGAALTGAVAYMFSDVFLIHLGNLNLIAVAAWLPLVFLFFHRALTLGSPGQAALAGFFLALSILAGHIQISLFIVLLVCAYAMYWIGTVRRRVRPALGAADKVDANAGAGRQEAAEGERGRRVGGINPERSSTGLGAGLLLVVTLVVAGALSAALLLPATEMSRHTVRAELDYREATDYSLPPGKLIGLLIPSFFERDPGLHWGPWDRVEVGYLGILPLVLALLALLLLRDRLNLFLLLLVGGALFVALGANAIVHGWVYDLVPGFSRLRAPARIVLLMDFGLAVLAARGLGAVMRPLDSFQRRSWRRFMQMAPWLLVGTVLFTAPLAYYAILMGQEKDPAIFSRIARAGNGLVLFLVFLAGSFLLLALRRWGWVRPATLGLLAAGWLLIDLGSTGAYLDLGRKPPTAGYDHPKIVEFLKKDPELYRIDSRTDIWNVWQPDTPLLHGISDVWGVVNPLTLADYDRYWENMGSRSSPLYDFLNAKYVIARKDVDLDWTKFVPVFDGDPELNVYLNRNALPRAFAVHQATVVPDQKAAFEAVHQPGFDPSRRVVIEGGRELPPFEGEPSGTVQVVHYALNHIDLAVDMPAAGYLVLSEVAYPGWEARVDGRVSLLYRANFAFRAVYLERGSHQVSLAFRPLTWYLGLGISGVTLALLAGWAVVACRRRQ